jgi:hypothetical protein
VDVEEDAAIVLLPMEEFLSENRAPLDHTTKFSVVDLWKERLTPMLERIIRSESYIGYIDPLNDSQYGGKVQPNPL